MLPTIWGKPQLLDLFRCQFHVRREKRKVPVWIRRVDIVEEGSPLIGNTLGAFQEAVDGSHRDQGVGTGTVGGFYMV